MFSAGESVKRGSLVLIAIFVFIGNCVSIAIPLPSIVKQNVTHFNDTAVHSHSTQADRCIHCILPSGEDFQHNAFIKRPPETYVAFKESTAVFECIPSLFNISSDDVTVTWTIPFSVPVTSYDKLHSEDATGAFITPNSSILIMKNVQPEFSGIYQCVVETSDSTIIAEMNLIVRIYVIDLYSWLIAGIPGFLLISMCIVITFFYCRIEKNRREFYRARRIIKEQQVLYKY